MLASIQWNEEFVLSVPNKSSHLVIDLKDYNKVFSNKAIGIARLDVANLPNDQICDIKLQLPVCIRISAVAPFRETVLMPRIIFPS
jgi:hypothetical protein